MWEDEVHENALGIGNGVGLKAFRVMDSFRKIGVRDRVGSKSSGELHGRFR